MPADPTLKKLAERIEVELRQQVAADIDAGPDVEPPLGVAHRADFEALDAQVQAGGIIIAGTHYGREEVEAARRLLRELGQSERSLRSVLEFVRRERVSATPPSPAGIPVARATAAAPVPAHRRIDAKRRALDQLTRRWAELRRAIDPGYVWPKAQARVNRAIGVSRRSDAGEADLDAGLAFLHAELHKLSRMYPAQADRLRIAASVEAIGSRLRSATGDGGSVEAVGAGEALTRSRQARHDRS